MSTLHNALIIGSGLAGLNAARILTNAGIKPIILEARSRVGGRACTFTDGLDVPVDVGCAYVHGCEEGNPMTEMLQEQNIDIFVTKGAETMVVDSNGPMSPSASSAVLSNNTSIYKVPHPPPHADISIASALMPTLSSPEALALARTTEIGAGLKLEEISAKYWGFSQNFSGTDGMPVGGFTSIINKWVDEIQSKGAVLELQKEVASIEDLGPRRGVKVTTSKGDEYTAQTVICTIPLGVMKVSPPKFLPILPPPFLAAVQRTKISVLEKVILSYDSAWWPSSSTISNILSLPTKEPSCLTSPPPASLSEMFSETTLKVSSLFRSASVPQPALLVYFGAQSGAYLNTYTRPVIGQELHKYLSERLGLPDAPLPKNVVRTDWLGHKFTRGAHSAPVTIFSPTSRSDEQEPSPLDFVRLSRSTWGGRLGFAGEHTDLDHRGSVVGAILSGEREGKRVAGIINRVAAKSVL